MVKQEEEVEVVHLLQCTGLRGAHLIQAIVIETEVEMRQAEGRRTNLPKEIKNLLKSKKLIRKNAEGLPRTKYGSPAHWERPLEKPPNVKLNPRENTTRPNTRISGSG